MQIVQNIRENISDVNSEFTNSEYEYTIMKYGEETGKEIFGIMFGHYNSLAMLDTNCYDLLSIEDEVRHIANTLKLEYKVIPATIWYIKALLTGPWNNDLFLTIPPRSVIDQVDLTITRD